MDSHKIFILENTHSSDVFLNVSGSFFCEYSVRTLRHCQCSQSLEMAISEVWSRVSHTAEHCLFLSSEEEEAEFFLLHWLTVFCANICIQGSGSCWEGGPWGNFRDISAWREVAAVLGAPQNCSQPRRCCLCFWAALGAAKWLVLDLSQEGDNREGVCCIWLHQAR